MFSNGITRIRGDLADFKNTSSYGLKFVHLGFLKFLKTFSLIKKPFSKAVADIHNEVARGEKHFRQTTNALILSQLNDFLTMADDVIRERRQVENLRLDLDSAKNNLAQRPTQESEEFVNLCQDWVYIPVSGNF